MKNDRKNMMEAGAVLLVILIVFGYGFFFPRMHPERSVSRFLNAMRDFNTSRIAKTYSGSYDDFDYMSLILAEESSTEETTKKLSEKELQRNKDFSSMLYEFDYELGDVAIDHKTATVDATIHAYPIGEQWKETGGDRAALLKLKKGDKSYTTKTRFSLAMKNGYWYVEPLNDENKDALSGGLYHILAGTSAADDNEQQEE